MSRKQKDRNINKVFIVPNSDDTITANFLGAVLLKKAKLPIDEKIANELIEMLEDDERRAEFCVKKGINEQMANEAVKAGAAQIFAKELVEFSCEPSAKKAKLAQPPSSPPKKIDELQSPSPKKTPAMTKKKAAAAKKARAEASPVVEQETKKSEENTNGDTEEKKPE